MNGYRLKIRLLRLFGVVAILFMILLNFHSANYHSQTIVQYSKTNCLIPLNFDTETFATTQWNPFNWETTEPQTSSTQMASTAIANDIKETSMFGAMNDKFIQYVLDSLNSTVYPGVELYTSYKIARLRLKPLAHVKPLRPEFGDVLNDVSSWRYIIESCKCEQHFDGNSTKKNVFIGIVTGPSYFERRNVIRQTWFRHLRDAHYHQGLMDAVGFTFFMGRSADNVTQSRIEEEARIHKDILQIDIVDDYFDLARKATALFYWIVNKCSDVKVDFVLKVDDDVYVNIRMLASATVQLSPDENYFMGNLANYTVFRKRFKMISSFEEWPWTEYPKFVQGVSNLFPAKALPLILAATQTIPYYKVEDAYLTGLCREKANMQLRHSKIFYAGDKPILEEVRGSCYLRIGVTWMTYSAKVMNSSHSAIEKFYNKTLECFLDEGKLNKSDNKIVANPDHDIKITYDLIKT